MTLTNMIQINMIQTNIQLVQHIQAMNRIKEYIN